MADDIAHQNTTAPKKEQTGGSGNNNRGPKKTGGRPSGKPNGGGGGARDGGQRPTSRSSDKKGSPQVSNAELSSDAKGKGPDNKRGGDQRSRSAGGGRNNSNPSRRSSTSNRQAPAQSSTPPVPMPPTETGDVLSNLHRVINDLKATAPAQPQPPANSLSTSIHAPQNNQQPAQQSSLPANAPVFQPGAAAYPGVNPIHRKAASVGVSALAGNFNSFSPDHGGMSEIAEEPGSAGFEEGEIQEQYYHQQPQQQPQQQQFHARAQSQGFMPPRFAALQGFPQNQPEPLSPSGRPQLAPGFMFGGGAPRRRGPSGPMGPPINEEDAGFQFPQQQQSFPPDVQMASEEHGHRKTASQDIMAESVRGLYQLFPLPFPTQSRSRWPSKAKLKRCKLSSRRSTSNSLRLTR